MLPLAFPARLHRLDKVKVVRLPRDAVYPAKHFLKHQAKEVDLYHLPIHTSLVDTDGPDAEYVDTVGAWLFGTSKYTGHLRVTELDDRLVKLEWPSASPGQVHDLIRQLVERVEV